ncbi:hypothetical protein AVEN_198734-1 [Araneus ventricosus]|uniref:Uncharacterized protein n=1 Tax=Araneus ventricosus TaxID=182803 RepID=A0A4Y2EP52_ARAVE|nr:hypothetical protein AVEN_110783-1 [Araneus ventricosus]GBM31032.1 hypothetical protein AVEN_198734-1 [Araneus ventricosus]
MTCAQNIISEAVPGGGIRGKINGYGGFHEWPPRSPDPTPMDFFLRGYLKPSANIAGPSTTHYGCLCQRETHNALTNVLSRVSVGNREQTNTCFKRSDLSIYVHNVSFCTKSMLVYSFEIHFFPLSRTILEVITLTPSFYTKCRCRWFHLVAHSHFTIPRYHSYEDSCSHSVVKRMAHGNRLRFAIGHHPNTALIFQAISEPHLPSKEANRLKQAFFALKGKFLDRPGPLRSVSDG